MTGSWTTDTFTDRGNEQREERRCPIPALAHDPGGQTVSYGTYTAGLGTWVNIQGTNRRKEFPKFQRGWQSHSPIPEWAHDPEGPISIQKILWAYVAKSCPGVARSHCF